LKRKAWGNSGSGKFTASASASASYGAGTAFIGLNLKVARIVEKRTLGNLIWAS